MKPTLCMVIFGCNNISLLDYYRMFARSYFEKHFKNEWRPENATITSFTHAHQAAASAFLAPVQPLQLLPGSSKMDHHRPHQLPPVPGPTPAFR